MFKIFAKELNDVQKEKLLLSIKRTLSKFLPICFLALLIAALICSVANDMYAFVKTDNEISLSFDSHCSLDEFSQVLADKGVVKNPDVFKLYVKLKDKEALIEGFSGELKLNTSMSYREILSKFS